MANNNASADAKMGIDEVKDLLIQQAESTVDAITNVFIDFHENVVPNASPNYHAAVAAPAPAPCSLEAQLDGTEPNQEEEEVAVVEQQATGPNQDEDVVFVNAEQRAYRTIETVVTKCPYCRNFFAVDEVLSVKCGHLYCTTCIELLTKTTQKCAICGQHMKAKHGRRIRLNM